LEASSSKSELLDKHLEGSIRFTNSVWIIISIALLSLSIVFTK
jgi:hypothetical protein